MPSNLIDADAGIAFSNWTQTAIISGRVFSIHITGGDPNYGTKPNQAGIAAEDSYLWARKVRVTLDPAGGGIRYRYDGGYNGLSPLFSGHVLSRGDVLELKGWENIRRFQFASNEATAGILNITAER